MFGKVAADLVECARRDPGAVAQPRHQLAVIDDKAPKGRFRRLRGPAIISDFAQDLIGGPRLVLVAFNGPHDELRRRVLPGRNQGRLGIHSQPQSEWASLVGKCPHPYWRPGHCGGWLPRGIAGRDQNAGVRDSCAAWRTALSGPKPDGTSSTKGLIASPSRSPVFRPSIARPRFH